MVVELFRSIDPFAPAHWAVAWAGEEPSAHWFDVGRDYTERWLHQQQIRDAVGAPPLTGREWLHPVLDLFVRARPVAYRDRRQGGRHRRAARHRGPGRRRLDPPPRSAAPGASSPARHPAPDATVTHVRRHRLAAVLEGTRPGGRARPRPDRRRSGARRRSRSARSRVHGLRPRAGRRAPRVPRPRPPCRPPRPEGPPRPPAARPSRTPSAAAPAPRARAVPREARSIRSTSSRRAPAAISIAAPASPSAIRRQQADPGQPTATRGSRPLSAACHTPATTSGIISGRQCSSPRARAGIATRAIRNAPTGATSAPGR